MEAQDSDEIHDEHFEPTAACNTPSPTMGVESTEMRTTQHACTPSASKYLKPPPTPRGEKCITTTLLRSKALWEPLAAEAPESAI